MKPHSGFWSRRAWQIFFDLEVGETLEDVPVIGAGSMRRSDR